MTTTQLPCTEANMADGEYTGGKTSYYEVTIRLPTREGRAPYVAECNDIIEALNMTFAEGEAFKAVWRRAASRQRPTKKGYDSGAYDAAKVAFYGRRMEVQQEAYVPAAPQKLTDAKALAAAVAAFGEQLRIHSSPEVLLHEFDAFMHVFTEAIK